MYLMSSAVATQIISELEMTLFFHLEGGFFCFSCFLQPHVFFTHLYYKSVVPSQVCLVWRLLYSTHRPWGTVINSLR